MKRIYTHGELEDLIQTRRPYLMVDRVQVSDDGTSAIGIKAASMDEAFFQGHFPGNPVMPGVLQVAAMQQVSTVLLARKAGALNGKVPRLHKIEQVKFRKPVAPGDLVRIEADRDPEDDSRFHARTLVGEEVTSQGTMTLELADPDAVLARPDEISPALPKLTGLKPDTELGVTEIMDILPHRFPFLLVDRILSLDTENMRIVGLKNVTGTEPFFGGTGALVLPGCLQAEIAAQVGCSMALAAPEHHGKLVFFMAIDSCVFHHSIFPGDQLVVDIKVAAKRRFGRAGGPLYVGNRVVAEIATKFAIVEQP